LHRPDTKVLTSCLRASVHVNRVPMLIGGFKTKITVYPVKLDVYHEKRFFANVIQSCPYFASLNPEFDQWTILKAMSLLTWRTAKYFLA
jgi:hypothetical protein